MLPIIGRKIFEDFLDLPYTWSFADGIGKFRGANLSIVSSKLAITPTLGDEMWDAAAAAFTAGTYAWVAQGGNTIANVGNALAITYVDNGAGAKELLADAADLNADLTIGQWYQFQATQSINIGAANLGFSNYRFGPLMTTTPTAIKIMFMAYYVATDWLALVGLGAGEVATIDNLSLKPLTLSTMLACGLPISGSNVIVKAAWTAGAVRGRAFGVAVCLDSYANPQNGLVGYHDGTSARLIQLVAGVPTALISVTTTYVADASIEIRKSRSTVDLYYNNAKVGITQTVTDASVINNRLHAPFAGDPDSVCSSFSITAN
jgi:hypothetical protein